MRIVSAIALCAAVLGAPTVIYDQATPFAENSTPLPNGANGASLDQKILHGGKQEGVYVLDVTVPGSHRVRLIPSRGLNVYKVYQLSGTGDTATETELGGWNNGVNEIVNPIYVNQMDRGGSGFLDAFNEMVVRCGYEYVGHAGEDGDNGLLTLHGKAANIPVSTVAYEVVDNTVNITGTLYERAFKKSYFTMYTSIVISLDTISDSTPLTLTISDTLVNDGAYEAEYMALYHSNFGRPILDAQSTLLIPARQVSPFNDAAIPELDTWDTLKAPTAEYDETVYNIFPYGDAQNITTIAMINEPAGKGIQMSFDITTLPALSLWKNLELEPLGYAVGLEPGTSFSYNRVFQRELNLVPTLPAGASVVNVITYTFLTATQHITDAKAAVDALRGEVEVVTTPLSDEGASAASGGDSATAKLLGTTLAVAAPLLMFGN